MHGVVFSSLRDYVAAEHGADAEAAVFAELPHFLLSETYPDELLHELVERTAAETGQTVEETLRGVGAFTAERTFVRLYPAFFAIAPSAREFLLTVETRIHELVRATIPNAEPPSLSVSADGDEGVRIEYRSPRRLCMLMRGLVEGTAAHYGERVEIEEPSCMLRGDAECVQLVRPARD